jgi:hypothetical protein
VGIETQLTPTPSPSHTTITKEPLQKQQPSRLDYIAWLLLLLLLLLLLTGDPLSFGVDTQQDRWQVAGSKHTAGEEQCSCRQPDCSRTGSLRVMWLRLLLLLLKLGWSARIN